MLNEILIKILKNIVYCRYVIHTDDGFLNKLFIPFQLVAFIISGFI